MEGLKKIQRDISKKISKGIVCREWHSSIILEGRVETWDAVIKAGYLAANRGYKGVVNRIEADGIKLPKIKSPSLKDNYLDGKRIDVLIIGGGIIGCSIARELSKWNISVLLIEKEEDVAMQASSRNDGMIHPGVEPKSGSLKAKFNIQGNRMYTKIAEELNVPINRLGSVVLFDKKIMAMMYPVLRIRGRENGVDGMKLLSREEVKKREPFITDDIEGGVYFPSTGVTSPYKMTVAYAENAIINGVEISLNTIANSIGRDKERIVWVDTNRGRVFPRVVINAAGVFSDVIADMAGDGFFTIHPRKGQIIIIDRKKGYLLNSVVAKPEINGVKRHTKGGGVVKTVDGNILIGPDAYEQPYREDFSTNKENIDALIKKHFPIIKGLSRGDIITYFSGIRAASYEEDFIVEKSQYISNLIHAAAIQSPGFVSAPAISREIEKITVELLSKSMDFKPKNNWNPRRQGIPDIRKMSSEERCQLIKNRLDYGVIVCRCEEISKGEIIDAIRSPLPVATTDGIKRRVRPGMGRCQGGFCLPGVMEILNEEIGIPMTSITKKGGNSNILSEEAGENLEVKRDGLL